MQTQTKTTYFKMCGDRLKLCRFWSCRTRLRSSIGLARPRWSSVETDNYIPGNSVFHGTVHETRCPSPGCSLTQDRQLALNVRRRFVFVPSSRRKLLDRGDLAAAPIIRKSPANDRRFATDALPCLGVGGVASTRGTGTSRVRAPKRRPLGRARRF